MSQARSDTFFLFLTASVIAFLLNPLVRDLQRTRLPRGSRSRSSSWSLRRRWCSSRSPSVGRGRPDTICERTHRRLPHRRRCERQDERRAGHRPAAAVVGHTRARAHPDPRSRRPTGPTTSAPARSRATRRTRFVRAGRRVLDRRHALQSDPDHRHLRYMLLDMRGSNRDRSALSTGTGRPLTQRIERALAGYVRGQMMLSTVIGLSAGIGMWVLGQTGLVPGADRYALLFGVWTAVIEVIPYIGPWLSSLPPIIYALVVDPDLGGVGGAPFIFIYQVEGHIVGPERDGERPSPPSPARHLRPARRRRAVRHRRGARCAADDGRDRAPSGSSSASGSSSTRWDDDGGRRCRSRSRSSRGAAGR